jgi:hypothetical protein
VTEASVPTLNLYFPLWGASFDSDGIGAIGPGVLVYVPNADEWRTIQKKDVWTAQWRSEGGRGEGPTPPCCIVVSTPLGSADSIYAAIDQMGKELLSMARTAVTTLRLFRPGWFLQPEQAMYVFCAPSLPLNVLRAPGPYRQVFVSNPTHIPMARLVLKRDDLTQRLESPGPIAATWELLQDYLRSGGNASVEIAIESFNHSYGFQLRPSSRAANLFTALDAMLGGMSAWKIGRVPVKPRGYARRVEVALRCATEPSFPGDPHDAARWLHSASGGRGLRNAIAHGTGSEVQAEANDAYERLQAIVGALLRQYLHVAIIWARQPEETAARLGLGAGSPVAAAYVTTLETEAKRPGSMLDLLQGAHIV